MNNAARHGIGALAGVIATPLIAGCLAYGVDKVSMSVQLAAAAKLNGVPAEDHPWGALAALLAGAAVIGLVVNARLSPLASLVPGLLIGLVGLLWTTETAWMVDQSDSELIPDDFQLGYMNMAANGTLVVIGVALVVASVSPQRWRGARAETPAPIAPITPREPRPDDDLLES